MTAGSGVCIASYPTLARPMRRTKPPRDMHARSFVLSALTLTALASSAHATNIGGGINADTTWTAAASP